MSNQEKTITTDQIYHSYSELFPTEFEFLVLYHLHINYPSSEIQYAEIKQAIVDTSHLPFISTGKNRQIERTFKELLRTFIERVPSKSNLYILTPHTEKVLDIAISRLNNPYLKFPLKETFETYFKLPDDATNDIKVLQAWFKLGFQNNARQIVLGHLESLKLSVDDAVKALNRILEADNLSAMEMLEQFSNNFQLLGDKARQITEAIKMKVNVHYQLRDIVEGFISKELSDENLSTEVDGSQNNRQKASQIKAEVYTFFDKVDKQLDVINAKMAFASSKITELQESLRTQSRYKINLKKLLLYLLENSRAIQQPGLPIHLPDKFPKKYLVMEKFKLRSIRYYDMGFLKKAKPFEQGIDPEYEETQRKLIEHELYKQVLIKQYCQNLQDELKSSNELDLNNELVRIMNQKDGLELGIQTSYEFIRNLNPASHIEIQEELQIDEKNRINLWKTTIRNDGLSTS